MFQNNVRTFKNLPVQSKLRKRTDCLCTIISSIFALTLFILSFILFRKENYYQTNFPVNSNGQTCSYDLPEQPYLYFSNPNDLSQSRFCVSSCPKTGQPLSCSSSQAQQCIAFGGSQYETRSQINRLGAFCIPINEDVANHLFSQPQISIKSSILNSIDTILLSLLFGLSLGIIYMILVSLCPKTMVKLVFIGCFLALLFVGIFMLVKPVRFWNPNVWNILLAIGFIIVALVFLIFMICHKKELQLASIFIVHANNFLKVDPYVFIYIPVFILLTFGLIVLIVWQYVAFGTTQQTYLSQNEIYRSSSHNIPLQILNAIELIWGLQFLRDAFNFIISGNSVEWYFRSQDNDFKSHCCHPLGRLIMRNWGSVAGGAFLNAFFIIFDSISDIFRCDARGPCAKCSNVYDSCCCCRYIFELVRTDAYGYISLTGIPYCNAARQCEALCQKSQGFRGSQSCLRLYRNAAHILLVSIVGIISYFILQSKGSTYTNWLIIALIVFGSYCISTYFIDIHANAAQGLMVSYLMEHNCEGEYMEVCPPALKEDMYHYNYQLHL